MIKAVVFDFDGLIFNTETEFYKMYKHDLQKRGIDLPLEIFSQCIGTTDEVMENYVCEHILEPFDFPTWHKALRSTFIETTLAPIPRDGVREYLEAAKNAGLKIGLATSSEREWIDVFLNRLGLMDFFDVIVTRELVERVKPDPALYLLACENLAVKPSEAVAFEDSLNGLNAALAAGMKCVVVPNEVTDHLDFKGHSARLKTMAEKNLHKLLSEL